MRVLIFGSRSLTWKHLPIFRAVALHSTLSLGFENEPGGVPAMSERLIGHLMSGGDDEWPRHEHHLVLINGDGPPGKERGAIGADKLAVLACMEGWREDRRRIRWFPPDPEAGETWGQAAGRRNRQMVEMQPHRSYCIHTDLDSSKGSSMTASMLTGRGQGFWYIRVSAVGGLLEVQRRGPVEELASREARE